MDEEQSGLWFPEFERCRVNQAAKRPDETLIRQRPPQCLGNLASSFDLRQRHDDDATDLYPAETTQSFLSVIAGGCVSGNASSRASAISLLRAT